MQVTFSKLIVMKTFCNICGRDWDPRKQLFGETLCDGCRNKNTSTKVVTGKKAQHGMLFNPCALFCCYNSQTQTDFLLDEVDLSRAPSCVRYETNTSTVFYRYKRCLALAVSKFGSMKKFLQTKAERKAEARPELPVKILLFILVFLFILYLSDHTKREEDKIVWDIPLKEKEKERMGTNGIIIVYDCVFFFLFFNDYIKVCVWYTHTTSLWSRGDRTSLQWW